MGAGLRRAFTAAASTNSPRPYNLSDPIEVARLHRELRGYIDTCKREHHGTDFEGRRFALEALEQLVQQGL